MEEDDHIDLTRLVQNQELRLLRRPTKLSKAADRIPKPRSGLPGNSLPLWDLLNLDDKIPSPPAPNGTFTIARTELAQPLFINAKNQEFDTFDPYINQTPIEYNSLHDPHLKNYFQSHPYVVKQLVDFGLLTENGEVVCNIAELNQYRMYLSRIHNVQIKNERSREADLCCNEKEQVKRVKRWILKQKMDTKAEETRRRRSAILRANEKKTKLIRRKLEDHPSNWIHEHRAEKNLILKRKRELRRRHVAARLHALKKAQLKRTRMILLHIMCEEDFSQRLRDYMDIERRINYCNDLKNFIENKRKYQSDKLRYHRALLKRDEMERDCRIEKREAYFCRREVQDKENVKKRLKIEKQKQDRIYYLMNKYGMRWLQITLRSHQDSHHESTWHVRNLLRESQKFVKDMSGAQSFSSVLKTLLFGADDRDPLKECDPETKQAVKNILDTLVDCSYNEFIQRATSCLVDFAINKARLKCIKHICEEGLDPNDLQEPIIPIRVRNQIKLPPPVRPCVGPCAELDWKSRCAKMANELQGLHDDLCSRLSSKLKKDLKRSEGGGGSGAGKNMGNLRKQVMKAQQSKDMDAAAETLAGIVFDRTSSHPADGEMQDEFADYAAERLRSSVGIKGSKGKMKGRSLKTGSKGFMREATGRDSSSPVTADLSDTAENIGKSAICTSCDNLEKEGFGASSDKDRTSLSKIVDGLDIDDAEETLDDLENEGGEDETLDDLENEGGEDETLDELENEADEDETLDELENEGDESETSSDHGLANLSKIGSEVNLDAEEFAELEDEDEEASAEEGEVGLAKTASGLDLEAAVGSELDQASSLPLDQKIDESADHAAERRKSSDAVTEDASSSRGRANQQDTGKQMGRSLGKGAGGAGADQGQDHVEQIANELDSGAAAGTDFDQTSSLSADQKLKDKSADNEAEIQGSSVKVPEQTTSSPITANLSDTGEELGKSAICTSCDNLEKEGVGAISDQDADAGAKLIDGEDSSSSPLTDEKRKDESAEYKPETHKSSVGIAPTGTAEELARSSKDKLENEAIGTKSDSDQDRADLGQTASELDATAGTLAENVLDRTSSRLANEKMKDESAESAPERLESAVGVSEDSGSKSSTANLSDTAEKLGAKAISSSLNALEKEGGEPITDQGEAELNKVASELVGPAICATCNNEMPPDNVSSTGERLSAIDMQGKISGVASGIVENAICASCKAEGMEDDGKVESTQDLANRVASDLTKFAICASCKAEGVEDGGIVTSSENLTEREGRSILSRIASELVGPAICASCNKEIPRDTVSSTGVDLQGKLSGVVSGMVGKAICASCKTQHMEDGGKVSSSNRDLAQRVASDLTKSGICAACSEMFRRQSYLSSEALPTDSSSGIEIGGRLSGIASGLVTKAICASCKNREWNEIEAFVASTTTPSTLPTKPPIQDQIGGKKLDSDPSKLVDDAIFLASHAVRESEFQIPYNENPKETTSGVEVLVEPQIFQSESLISSRSQTNVENLAYPLEPSTASFVESMFHPFASTYRALGKYQIHEDMTRMQSVASIAGPPRQLPQPYTQPPVSGVPQPYTQPPGSGVSQPYTQPPGSGVSQPYAQPPVSGVPQPYAQPPVSGVPQSYTQPPVSGVPQPYTQPPVSGVPQGSPITDSSTTEPLNAVRSQLGRIRSEIEIITRNLRNQGIPIPETQRPQPPPPPPK